MADDTLQSRLEPLRERIDALDTQILDLLNQRARAALEVGEVKKPSTPPGRSSSPSARP